MNEGQALLEIRDLHAGYGGAAVIDGLSLRVAPGETAALLGLNGSGKSTLLRLAAGLLSPLSGEAFVGGVAVRTMSARTRARHIGYIPQRSRCEEGMTALETVLMGANASTPLFGRYTRAQREKAKVCLERLDAGDLAHRTMGTLSQGQRQIVIFARTMMQEPQVYLLDEPDSALDLSRRCDMMRRVREMTAVGGRCALLALHDASLALTCCDRVMILRDGRIACALNMHEADEKQVHAAMQLLYGAVCVGRVQGRWAVVG